MLIYANLLKRDYEVTYTIQRREDDYLHGRVYKTIVKDCYTNSEAWQRWIDETDWDWADIDELEIEPIKLTHEQRVNEEVYELVLGELFDGQIGVYEYVDIRNADDYEITERLEGIERVMIEHEAHNRFMNSK